MSMLHKISEASEKSIERVIILYSFVYPSPDSFLSFEEKLSSNRNHCRISVFGHRDSSFRRVRRGEHELLHPKQLPFGQPSCARCFTSPASTRPVGLLFPAGLGQLADRVLCRSPSQLQLILAKLPSYSLISSAGLNCFW